MSCKVVGSEPQQEESKTAESNKGYGFVCFKNCSDARAALQKFMETTEPKTDSAPTLAGTGEPQAFDDEDPEAKNTSKAENVHKLYVAPHLRREVRDHILRLKTLRFKRTMARHNLYFRGFPVGKDIDALKQQLTEYFA